MAGREGQAFQCSLWLCKSNLVVTPSGKVGNGFSFADSKVTGRLN